MPGSTRSRARLFREHVIVIEPRTPTAHQLRTNRAELRFEDEAPIRGIFLPATEILAEESRILAAARDLGTRARAGEIRLDALLEQRHFFGVEQLPKHHGAVPLKRLHVRSSNRGSLGCHRWIDLVQVPPHRLKLTLLMSDGSYD